MANYPVSHYEKKNVKNQLNPLILLAHPTRLEHMTYDLEGCRQTQKNQAVKSFSF